MVFGLATIGLDGFSMVANHWSNDGMVTIRRYGLDATLTDEDTNSILTDNANRAFQRNVSSSYL